MGLLSPDQVAKPGCDENAIQTAFFMVLPHFYEEFPELKWIYAVPNGVKTKGYGRLKAEGLRKGVFDVCIPFRCNEDVGSGYIEFKKPERKNDKDGGLSEDQVEFKEHCTNYGLWCCVVYSWRQALEGLSIYLSASYGKTIDLNEKYDELCS